MSDFVDKLKAKFHDPERQAQIEADREAEKQNKREEREQEKKEKQRSEILKKKMQAQTLAPYEEEMKSHKTIQRIKIKLQDARARDLKHKLIIDPDLYVDLQWVKEQALSLKCLCSKCNKKMKFKEWETRDRDQFMIGRKIITQPHNKNNCYLQCYDCYLTPS